MSAANTLSVTGTGLFKDEADDNFAAYLIAMLLRFTAEPDIFPKFRRWATDASAKAGQDTGIDTSPITAWLAEVVPQGLRDMSECIEPWASMREGNYP